MSRTNFFLDIIRELFQVSLKIASEKIVGNLTVRREKETFQASHLRSFNRYCNEESHFINSCIWLNGVPSRRFFSVRLVVSRVAISRKCSYSSKAGEKYGARAARDTNPSKPNVLKTCFSSTAEKGTATTRAT